MESRNGTQMDETERWTESRRHTTYKVLKTPESLSSHILDLTS